MEAVDRWLVIRAIDVIGERVCRVEQPHAEALAAAVWFQNERAEAKSLPRCLKKEFFAKNEDSIRCVNASSFEGGILARLADLQVERAAAVDNAAPMPLEPGQHRSRQLGGIAMVASVRGGAHPIVEDAPRRRLRQIENTPVKEPVMPGKGLPIQRCRQRLEPSRIFMDYVDVRHQILPPPSRGNYTLMTSQFEIIYVLIPHYRHPDFPL